MRRYQFFEENLPKMVGGGRKSNGKHIEWQWGNGTKYVYVKKEGAVKEK